MKYFQILSLRLKWSLQFTVKTEDQLHLRYIGGDQEGVSRLSHVLRQKKFWFGSRYGFKTPTSQDKIRGRTL